MADPVATELVGGTSTSAVTTPTFSARTAGEFLILSIASDDYRLTSGSNRPESSGWTFLNGFEGNLGRYTWYKVAAGGETSVSYAIGSAARSAYTVTTVTNVDTTSPLGATNSNNTIVSASLTGMTVSSITPTAGTRWGIIAIVGSTGNVTSGPYSWTAPIAKVGTDRYHTAGYRPGITVAARVVDGGTSVGATVAVATTCDQLSGTIIALRESTAGGGAPITGTLGASTPRATSSIAGTATPPTYAGTVVGSVPRAQSSMSGTVAAPVYTGAISATLPKATASIAGTVTAPSTTGTLNAQVPRAQSTIVGTATPPTYTGSVGATLPKTTGSISGTASAPVYSGTIGASFPPTRATIAGDVTSPAGAGALSGTLPRVTAALAGTVTVPTWTGELDAQAPSVVGTITGTVTGPQVVGSVDSTLPATTGQIAGVFTAPVVVGSLTASLPVATASLVGVVVIDDDLVPASGRILASTVRAPSVRGEVRVTTVRGTLRTPTIQGRLR